jgi:endonuclease-3
MGQPMPLRTTGHSLASAHVPQVCRALIRAYSPTRLGNKLNPLDEFLYILLSLRTNEVGLTKAYRAFKRRFPRWHSVDTASVSQIEDAIRPGGLARQKAAYILNAIRLIKSRFGEVSLDRLKGLPQNEIEEFLLSLPGVGKKSARCIMMYSLGLDVLPADTHVMRITRRLGWVDCNAGRHIHDRLDMIVPVRMRYRFHVTCVQHGRRVCRGSRPQCDNCCLRKWCRRCGLDSQTDTSAVAANA